MLTIVFLVFIGMFAIAGVFISLEAKRREKGSQSSAVAGRDQKPGMGRATPDND
jgi:cbb3-type cytochrome oxidase subunit 3